MDHDVPALRSIDVSHHIARFAARPERLVTTARRLTRDIPLNQALVAALEVLRRVPLGPATSTRVARLRPGFGDTSVVPVAAASIPHLGLTTLTARYADALALAEIILRSQSLAPRLATISATSIVYSMPKIWETYVFQKIQQAFPEELEVVLGYPFALSTDGGFPSQADTVVLHGDDVIRLFDAKYKWLDKAPSRDDVYQMVAYCERLTVSEATLVYPATIPSRHTIQVGKRALHVVGLPGPSTAGESGADALKVLNAA